MEPATLDVMVDGEKVGEAYNINPNTLTGDSECRDTVIEIVQNVDLTPDEKAIFDKVLATLTLEEDQEVDFTIDDLLNLSSIAGRHLDYAVKILSVSQYMVDTIDMDSDMPPEFFLNAAQAHAGLGDLLVEGIKRRNGQQ